MAFPVKKVLLKSLIDKSWEFFCNFYKRFQNREAILTYCFTYTAKENERIIFGELTCENMKRKAFICKLRKLRYTKNEFSERYLMF